jgi:HPt (histidine-containing phosphotransfer) domain-containing protein
VVTIRLKKGEFAVLSRPIWLLDTFGDLQKSGDIVRLARFTWKDPSMPSPPPAAENGPIDIEHLRRATLGDANLEREVLGMFAKQAAHLVGALAALPPEASALAHTLKGSARAIGAFQVADHADGLEAAIRDGGDGAQALAELNAAVAQAQAAIEAILARP